MRLPKNESNKIYLLYTGLEHSKCTFLLVITKSCHTVVYIVHCVILFIYSTSILFTEHHIFTHMKMNSAAEIYSSRRILGYKNKTIRVNILIINFVILIVKLQIQDSRIKYTFHFLHDIPYPKNIINWTSKTFQCS
jgi:hypothetical protein